MSAPVTKMQVTVEKAVCPECGKHIMHLKAHMKRNHPVVKPKEAVPDLTIDLLAPSPEQVEKSIPAPVEKPIEKPIVAPPVAPEPELPEPVALPPTPPPTPKPTPSFAAVVTTVAASNSSCSSAFTAVLPYKAPKRLSPLTLPSMTGERPLDYDRFMKNVLRHRNVAMPGRKSEWALLCHLWQSAPEKFQISKQHISSANPNPRVTVTIYRDQSRVVYSQYHIYMNPSAFAQALYIEGHDCGEDYRVVEFTGKEASA
jgi:ssDNA-binding Zn-finger/Zn-ribbon topoisomerase 1